MERRTLVSFVGAPVPPLAVAVLEARSPCFGERFAKSSGACTACRAPVIVDGELLLAKEVCAARCIGAEPGTIERLTSNQILERIETGKSVEEIFAEILDDADPRLHAATARNLLASRLRYLRDKRELGSVIPTCPPTKELRNDA